MLRADIGKRNEVNIEETAQNTFKGMVSHLGSEASAETLNSFGHEAFDITAYILDFIKNTFNPFSNTVEPTVKFGIVLLGLIGSFSSPNVIASLPYIRHLFCKNSRNIAISAS